MGGYTSACEPKKEQAQSGWTLCPRILGALARQLHLLKGPLPGGMSVLRKGAPCLSRTPRGAGSLMFFKPGAAERKPCPENMTKCFVGQGRDLFRFYVVFHWITLRNLPLPLACRLGSCLGNEASHGGGWHFMSRHGKHSCPVHPQGVGQGSVLGNQTRCTHMHKPDEVGLHVHMVDGPKVLPA